MRLLIIVSCLLISGAASAQDAAINRETCAGCHVEAEAFASGPHGQAMASRDTGILDRSCTSCHGAATEHVEDPSTENINRRPDAKACESCHQGASQQIRRMTPAHARHGVGCLECHGSGHEQTLAAHLFRDEPFVVCGSCHAEQRTAANLPFAHRNNLDPFPCTNCHSLHGVNRSARLSLGKTSGACLDCHTEKAGPHVFPHPPREIDGCVTCHMAHGSPNPRLLKRRVISSLCLECHAGVPSFHNLAQARYQACTSCHNAVHGSNRSSSLFDE